MGYEKGLIGKTITDAVIMKDSRYDDENLLMLKFQDGTYTMLTGGYTDYTGDSNCEYQTYIYVDTNRQGDDELDEFLVPVGK